MSSQALSSSPFSAFQVTLRLLAGPNKGDVYRILPPGAIIGRDALSCQVALMDARVSRQQCRLDYKMEGLTVEDLSGKQTTLVNQRPIQGEHLLQNGDVLTCGDTHISIEIQSDGLTTVPSASAPAHRPSPLSSTSYIPEAALPQNQPPAMDPQSKRLSIIVGIGLVIGLGLWLMPEDAPKPPPKIATSETINESIAAVQKRQEEILKNTSQLTELELYNKRSAQKHYIRGLRDYQNARYNRAIEAFQTALATDRTHVMARRYYKLAEKKRLNEVDYHMDLGLKYKDKAMYKMCIAEFAHVLQILNQPTNKKYQLAKEQIKECRLSIQEGI
jgi:pSer/pThr/pTyr-binding forkhead associated (FHA) protein